MPDPDNPEDIPYDIAESDSSQSEPDHPPPPYPDSEDAGWSGSGHNDSGKFYATYKLKRIYIYA